MRGSWLVGGAAAFSAICLGAAASADPCNDLPSDVTAYLNAHPDWAPVRKADLSADHQKLWEHSHGNACPGVAKVDLEGRGEASFGLALLRRSLGGAEEELVLVQRRSKGVSFATLVPPYRAPGPEVVWRVSPPQARDLGAPRRIVHDSLMLEAQESAAQLFYVRRGRVLKAQMSD